MMLLLLVALCPLLPPPPAPLSPGHSWPEGAEGNRCTLYLLLSPLTSPPSALLPPHTQGLTPSYLYIFTSLSTLPAPLLFRSSPMPMIFSCSSLLLLIYPSAFCFSTVFLQHIIGDILMLYIRSFHFLPHKHLHMQGNQ